MVINIVKYVAIAVLFGGVFTRSQTGLALILQFAVVAAAAVVLTQAATLHRYVWMTLFVLLACLFNPLFQFHSLRRVFGRQVSLQRFVSCGQ